MKKVVAIAFIMIGVLSFADSTQTVNGITWTYVTEAYLSTCAIGRDSGTKPAIATSTQGDITVPSTLGGKSVSGIRSWAFNGCSKVNSITVPDTVITIMEYAFKDCAGLTYVSLPPSVSLGHSCFMGCSNLTEITLPQGTVDLRKWTFSYCSSLRKVVIPDSVTQIGQGVFLNCSSLQELVIPSSVQTIGSGVFEGCSALSNLYLPRKFEGKTSNMSIPASCTVVFFDDNPVLSVSLSHGSCNPDSGNHTYKAVSLVDAHFETPASTDHIRYIFLGWSGSGSVPSSGTETNLTFVIESTSCLMRTGQDESIHAFYC